MDFYASAKLMLFGEYLILKGSKCLAFPLKYRQKCEILANNSNRFVWRSLEKGKEWFSCQFDSDLSILSTTDSEKAIVIQKLFGFIAKNKPTLFKNGLDFIIHADFLREWGLGSSSSLISILAQWSKMDPYELLEKSFGGSGYDVACATANTPILYRAQDKKTQAIELKESITSKLLFVYSGKSQSSKKEILRFSALKTSASHVEEMNQIIASAVEATEIKDFENAMEASENLIAELIQLEKIKTTLFNDYPYAIKSLGAWGGDFFMATFRDKRKAETYFKEKGYATYFTYNQLIKQ